MKNPFLINKTFINDILKSTKSVNLMDIGNIFNDFSKRFKELDLDIGTKLVYLLDCSWDINLLLKKVKKEYKEFTPIYTSGFVQTLVEEYNKAELENNDIINSVLASFGVTYEGWNSKYKPKEIQDNIIKKSEFC